MNILFLSKKRNKCKNQKNDTYEYFKTETETYV